MPLVAREHELADLARFASSDGGPSSAWVLEGEPGVGKTSLWEAGVALGRERGLRVLTARASEAETGLPHTALIDLLDGVADEELAPLPAPQRHALRVALYREEPSGHAPESPAVALGLLTALRSLAGENDLLVAVDDAQWLDQASDEVLAYAARRLDDGRVRFLLARRPGSRTALESAVPADRLHRVVVGPISLGATRHLLADRLGLRLPHHVLRRVYDATLGNPLFALEVGRVLAGRDLDSLGEDVPVPEHVEDLLGLRVDDLDPAVREVLLALSLAADLRSEQVHRLLGDTALEQAATDGVVALDGDRLRPSHPLLAEAARRRATPDATRRLHRELADVVGDEQRRVLHLALATTDPEDALAARLDEAAATAASRGAPRLAVQLGTHALRLTPPESPSRPARLLHLGRHLVDAGEKRRVTDLLADELAGLPDAASRVGARLLLMQGVVEGNDDIRRFLDDALADAGDDPGLRAQVLVELAENQAVVQVADVARAHERAAEAVAVGGDDEPRRHALTALAWTQALRGLPLDAVCTQYAALATDRATAAQRPDRIAAQRLVWRGEVEAARAVLTRLRTEAEDRAQPSSYALVRLHLCELELRTGDLATVQDLLDAWGDSADDRLLDWPMYERCRALEAAVRGDAEQARSWAQRTLDRVAATGVRWDWLEARRALGLADLVAGDPAGAVEHLGAVWDHTTREGVEDPGAFPAGPDLVQALVEVGDLDRARDVTSRLEALAEEQDHPWARAGARRGTALLGLTDGEVDAPARVLEDVAATYAALGLHHEEARTRLALGHGLRRARKWGAAREALEAAVAGFDERGSTGWAVVARAELDRVGARRPAEAGLLTTTEARVAALVAEGMSNKEVARTLVVTVNTVEFHLRNTYAKLGIRSRTQLAARLSDDGTGPGPGVRSP